ncbi:MAG: hypothetical protein WC789_08105 [Lentisphaeria bacterium]|jgi:hypothetical protein
MPAPQLHDALAQVRRFRGYSGEAQIFTRNWRRPKSCPSPNSAAHKEFVGVKPRTSLRLTATGLRQFTAYLDALEAVLKAAQQAVAPARGKSLAPARRLGHAHPAQA